MTLTSAAGLLSLLEDDRQDVQGFALTRLTDQVGEFWAEIFERATKLEDLIKDCGFKYKHNAALLASKVFFYSGAYEESLHYALCAQELFDINASTEFTDTLVSKCMDKYIELRLNGDSSKDNENYTKLEQVVNRMFERCFAHKQFKHALGMAIETRRMDMFKQAIILSPDCDGMLRYAYRVILTLIDSVHLRDQLMDILVRIYTTFPSPTDAINTCQCLLLINDAEQAANILETLILRSSEASVTAYQICFDLYENATQNYLGRLRTALRHNPKLKHFAISAEPKEGSSNRKNPAEGAVSGTGESATAKGAEDETGEMQSSEADSTNVALSEADEETRRRLNNLLTILSGDKTVEFYLEFLIGHSKGENRLLECIRDETRHSATHMAATLANGMMFCGTTYDYFLRKNLTWLKKAVNWAKFTAVSTLGVIHKGNEQDALNMISAYLPKDNVGSSGSVYTEGGGLFALGLIHANHGGSMIEYLLKQINSATAEPVRHGACLGLGLAAMGTGRDDVYEELKMKLHQDDAVTGEAAAIAMGLVMLGTGSTAAVGDLWSYAKDTAHEKIIRGIALGIAMVMYGRLEEADTLIDSLVVSNDPILRWCGMATIAMAYCGTGNNGAVQKLLHAAVSDTNNDVRRWAVTALGFILFKTPEQVPIAVSLLTDSYHPHVQYGAAMAMGIACAGTALKEALHLLETLCDGSVPFVRQGALIATALVLIQQNGITCPKSVEFREKCVKIITDRHEDLLSKFGAILACGILDAGGGNMTVSLQTRTGNNNMVAAVGLLVFQNYWFWYPLTNFISLAFSPTALIALNKDLKMPVMQFRSNAKPQTFAHAKGYQPEKEKKKEKVETAVLSITARQRKKEADRRQHREQHRKDSATSITAGISKTASKTVPPVREEKMDVDPEPSKAKRSERREEKEQTNFKMLNNPARVMWAQQRVMSIPESSRYQTIKPVIQSGILMVNDGRPDESERLVELKRVFGAAAGSSSTTTGGAAGAAEDVSRVFAVDIGACVDSSDEEDEDEEGEDEEASTESPDVHMAEPGQRAAAGKRAQSGKQSHTAVKPPEAFQYQEESGQGGGGGGATAAGSSGSGSTSAADAEAAGRERTGGSSEKNPPSKDGEEGKQ